MFVVVLNDVSKKESIYPAITPPTLDTWCPSICPTQANAVIAKKIIAIKKK